jgi:hypothetical protein
MLYISRLQLAAKASQASDKFNQADNEYQATLLSTNQKQTEYYTNTMPALLTVYAILIQIPINISRSFNNLKKKGLDFKKR